MEVTDLEGWECARKLSPCRVLGSLSVLHIYIILSAACGSHHGSSAECGDCSPWGPRNPKAVVTGRALSLHSCCTRLVRLYLQMHFSMLAAVRGHQEHQQCGLCSKDTAGGALEKRQIWEAWFMPGDVCYISWEEDSQSGLLVAFLFLFGPTVKFHIKAFVSVGSSCAVWLPSGGVHPPLSAWTYISLHGTV